MRIVALIPARACSKRVPGKNTRLLGGRPLVQWTIEAAKASGVFESINLCTDDEAVADVARDLFVPLIWREPVPDTEPDIVWVRNALEYFADVDAFAILRPTSPFRTAATIRRAVEQFTGAKCSSLRAVERVKQHPFKMWEWFDHMNAMKPLVDGYIGDGTPWHSCPTQSLQPIYVQNSSLEIAWTWCVTTFDSISGPKVAPFFTEGYEGLSIDYPEDFERAEQLLAGPLAHLLSTPQTVLGEGR